MLLFFIGKFYSMTVKNILFRFIFLTQVISMLISCSDTPPAPIIFEGDLYTSKTIIPFTTVMRWRSNKSNYDLNAQFVLKSENDRLNFLELPGSVFIPEQPFEFWRDSIMVGIVYGKRMSIIAEFEIDSLILNLKDERIEAYSHINDPLGDNVMPFQYFHFVKIPTYDLPLFIYEISDSTALPRGDSIPFRTLFNRRNPFRVSTPTPFMVVLKNKNDEEDFLKTTSKTCFGISCFTFPDFAYGDSMLVGVIGYGTSSSISFSILALMNKENRIEVNAAYSFFGSGLLFDHNNPIHFVVIKNSDSEFTLNELSHIGETID